MVNDLTKLTKRAKVLVFSTRRRKKVTESKIDGKMTDSKIKRILGAELKVGDVVVLTDDDGMDRYFTIREPLEAVDAIAQTRCVTFGGSTRAFGRKWYKHNSIHECSRN